MAGEAYNKFVEELRKIIGIGTGDDDYGFIDSPTAALGLVGGGAGAGIGGLMEYNNKPYTEVLDNSTRDLHKLLLRNSSIYDNLAGKDTTKKIYDFVKNKGLMPADAQYQKFKGFLGNKIDTHIGPNHPVAAKHLKKWGIPAGIGGLIGTLLGSGYGSIVE